ncbi:hypothetical protein ACOMHN_040882 [Nucella lapillus]
MTSAPLSVIAEDTESSEVLNDHAAGTGDSMVDTDVKDDDDESPERGPESSQVRHGSGSDGDFSQSEDNRTEVPSIHEEERINTTHQGIDGDLERSSYINNDDNNNNDDNVDGEVNDDDDNNNSNNNNTISSSNNCNNNNSPSKHGDQDGYKRQLNKKHVAWQTDCGEEQERYVSAHTEKDCSDQPPDCDNAVAGVKTPQPSPLTCGNTGITQPDIQHRENVSTVEEIKEKALCLAAQQNNGITDPENYLREVCVRPAQSSDTKNGSKFGCHPNVSGERRPASANEAIRRERQLLESKALSEEGLKPCSVAGFRRLSLPLNLRRRGSRENLQKSKDSENVNKPTDPSELTLNGFVPEGDKEGDKETKQAALVTYGEEGKVTHAEQEKAKSADVARDSRVVPIDKPSRAPPSRVQAHRRRPLTAGAARATGGRPGDRRMIHSAPARTAPLRPWEANFSKDELQRALPRRNFFSCHNKALKDAGFQVEEENSRPRRRRLLFFHHDEDDAEETPPKAAPPARHEPEGGKDGAQGQETTNVLSDNTIETAVQMLSFHDRARRRKSQLPQVVECKPLQLYLRHVADNPGEYRHMLARSCTSGPAAALHPSSHPADNCHTARLVSMGRIFEEKHGGPKKTDEVLRAAYSLNPRDADPFRFAKPFRDIKSPLLSGLASRKQSTLPNFPRKESAVSCHSGEEGSKSGEQRSKPGSEMMPPRHEAERLVLMENLTEVERLRLKAEEWARSVTTDQMVRAKLHVLRELGHEERELSQWWLAFRTCSYLRTRIRE